MKKTIVSMVWAASLLLPVSLFADSMAGMNMSSALLAANTITVSQGYVRDVPPGTHNTAMFLMLTNTGKMEQNLIAVVSPISNQTQLHKTIIEKGVSEYSMASMRQVNDIVLPAGKTVAFQPGSYHIMVMDLTGNLTVGQQVPVWLIFADGSHKEIMLPVVKK